MCGRVFLSVSSIGVPVKPMSDAFGSILRPFVLPLMWSLCLVFLVATSALGVALSSDGEASARTLLPDIVIHTSGEHFGVLVREGGAR